MAQTDYVFDFNHRVMTGIIRAFLSDDFAGNVEKIPTDILPDENAVIRGDLETARDSLRDKCIAALGFRIEDDRPDISLSDYARCSLERKTIEMPFMTVSKKTCYACGPATHVVTNMCQGCLKRPCTQCPFGAIEFIDGKSHINTEKCKNCGICAEACPYHAIIKRVIPCEDACPVDAIFKDENGKCSIDIEKCIGCGRCLRACPYGAILGKSEIIDVLRAIKDGKHVVAMVAPAIMGQIGSSVAQILGAVKQLGFSEVMEVAHGADVTSATEAKELAERLNDGAPFMTTSCCPAYTNVVKKHIPELSEFVSHTGSPMHYAAELVKKTNPESVTVFVGPCVAKREEGLRNDLVDFVLTNTELLALLDAMDIDVSAEEGLDLPVPSKQSRGYALSGGVAGAVKALNVCEVCPVAFNGLDRASVRKLRQYAKDRKADGNLVEIMVCNNGCIGGSATTMPPKKGMQLIQKAMAVAPDQVLPKE